MGAGRNKPECKPNRKHVSRKGKSSTTADNLPALPSSDFDQAHSFKFGEARAHQIATDARLDKLDQTIALGLKSVHDELEACFLKNQNNQTKWLISAIIAIAAVTVSIISVMFSQITPKANAPIVIYTQPQPIVATLQIPVALPPSNANPNR